MPVSPSPLQWRAEVGQLVNNLVFAGHTVSDVISDLPVARKQPWALCPCMGWLCSNKTLFAQTGNEADGSGALVC